MRKIGALFLALAFEMERMRKEEGKVPNLAFFYSNTRENPRSSDHCLPTSNDRDCIRKSMVEMK